MKCRGFTLIELVVVIGIIAVLTGLVTFNFQQARGRARDIQRKNDLKAMQKAVELYKGDQNPEVYPGGNGRLDVVLNGVVGASYIKRLPVDPRESASSGSWTHYTYEQTSTTTYTMTACLENASDNECDSPVSPCQGATNGCLMSVTEP